ncbi:MAG TPA: hypothetical protein ENJ84_06750 [Gammaproteobacteria bacterium]|nr:hypothetical protein [Gammaproteobacteria bacterium]
MTLALTFNLYRNWTWPGAKAVSSVAEAGAPSFVYNATNGATRIADWSYHGYVPVSHFIYAAFCSNAKGLLPPSDEWRRRGL